MIDDILKMWEKDSQIDDLNLDKTSTESAKLHSKYIQLLSMGKLRLKKKEMEYDQLFKTKWSYYNGKMTQAEMDALGWPYDPFQGGIKPIRGDLEMFYKTDPDLSKLTLALEYQKVLVETLIDIIDNIKWRHQTIRNILEWKKFTAGM